MGLNNKKLGLIIVVFSILLVIFSISSTLEIMKAENLQCENVCGDQMDNDCPHINSIPIQSYFSISLSAVIALIGVYLFFRGRKLEESALQGEEDFENILNSLNKDEKKLFKIILDKKAIMQSDLVEQTEFNKVKVSRLLDKLEGSGLVERRRRGMSNVVILKRQSK